MVTVIVPSNAGIEVRSTAKLRQMPETLISPAPPSFSLIRNTYTISEALSIYIPINVVPPFPPHPHQHRLFSIFNMRHSHSVT